jgi:hypothetical protein
MALAELCSRASLSPSFLCAVAVSLVRGMEVGSSEHVHTVLLVLAHAASTQRQLTELPTAALKVRARLGLNRVWGGSRV